MGWEERYGPPEVYSPGNRRAKLSVLPAIDQPSAMLKD
jgi:hypothetical protein